MERYQEGRKDCSVNWGSVQLILVIWTVGYFGGGTSLIEGEGTKYLKVKFSLLLHTYIEVKDQMKIGRPHERKFCHATLKLIKMF